MVFPEREMNVRNTAHDHHLMFSCALSTSRQCDGIGGRRKVAVLGRNTTKRSARGFPTSRSKRKAFITANDKDTQTDVPEPA